MPPKQLIILSNTILLINRVLNIALKSSYATQSYDIIVINLMLITSGMIYHTSPIAAIYPCYPTPTINTTPTHSTRKYIKVIILLHLHIGRERTYEELYPIDYVRDSCLSLPSLLVYCNRPMFTTITRGWYWSNRTILVAAYLHIVPRWQSIQFNFCVCAGRIFVDVNTHLQSTTADTPCHIVNSN